MKKSKAGAAWRELGRQSKLLAAKRAGGKVVPDKILRRLASFNLPASEFVYTAVLEKLLRENA